MHLYIPFIYATHVFSKGPHNSPLSLLKGGLLTFLGTRLVGSSFKTSGAEACGVAASWLQWIIRMIHHPTCPAAGPGRLDTKPTFFLQEMKCFDMFVG